MGHLHDIRRARDRFILAVICAAAAAALVVLALWLLSGVAFALDAPAAIESLHGLGAEIAAGGFATACVIVALRLGPVLADFLKHWLEHRIKDKLTDAELHARKQEFLRVATADLDRMRNELWAKFEVAVTEAKGELSIERGERSKCERELARVTGKLEAVMNSSLSVAERSGAVAVLANASMERLRKLEEKHPELFTDE